MADGYSKVAQLMCHSREYGMIRGFGALQVENTLFLQARVNQLETELQRIVEKDRIANHPQHPFYHRCWWSLNNSADFGNDEQLKKRQEIRLALKEYNGCLGQVAFLWSLPRPQRSHIRFFEGWLHDPEMGNSPISGEDCDPWSSEHHRDLVTFHASRDRDALFSCLARFFLPTYHLCLGKYVHKAQVFSGVANYEDSAIQQVLDLLLIAISSLFPVASITALYYVSDMRIRLAIIAATTASFSLCLAFATTAKRVEIFAVTTAFAAVEVVFIGTNNGPS